MEFDDPNRSYVKATAVVPTMEYVMFNYGKETYRKVLSELSPSLQGLFRKRMPTEQWIRLENFVAYNQAIINVVYRGDIEGAVQLGAESAEQGMSKMAKIVFRMGSINFLLPKGASIFSSYYKPAILEVKPQGSKKAIVIMRDMKDGTGIIARRVKGFLLKTLELSGSRNAHVEMDYNPNAPETVVYSGSWT
jgi:hypothetical protein